MYNDNPRQDKQFNYAFENGIPLILWVGENEIQQGIVKIKSLSKNEEYDIPRNSLKE